MSSSSWKLLDRNIQVILGPFFVNMIKSLPTLIEPLLKIHFDSLVFENINKCMLVLVVVFHYYTYDLRPFPYIPIMLDSWALLEDLPKVIMSADSSI